MLLFNGAVISWKSKRQKVVALSLAEDEFMAASSLVQEVICIQVRRLLDRFVFRRTIRLLLEKITFLALLGEKELLEAVIELNISSSVGILWMTQSKTGY